VKSSDKVNRIAVTACLCALGIIIPLYSPKIVLEPASFTLFSHVPIFLAMFLSPASAAIVVVATTLGFFLAGVPPVVVARAASHIVFAVVGALILQRRSHILDSFRSAALFAFLISLLHAICEVAVVVPFYLNYSMSRAYYTYGFVVSVLLLVGVGTIVHSLVDFAVSWLIWKWLRRYIAAWTPGYRSATPPHPSAS